MTPSDYLSDRPSHGNRDTNQPENNIIVTSVNPALSATNAAPISCINGGNPMNSDHSSKDPIQDDKEIGQNRPAIGQGGIISDTLESAAPAERIAAIIPTPIIEKSSDENQGNIPCGPCAEEIEAAPISCINGGNPMNSDRSSKNPIQDDMEIGQNGPATGQGSISGSIASDELEFFGASIVSTHIDKEDGNGSQGAVGRGPKRPAGGLGGSRVRRRGGWHQARAIFLMPCNLGTVPLLACPPPAEIRSV